MGKTIDHGNYIPEFLAEGFRVGEGEHVCKVFLLGGSAGQSDGMSEDIFIGLPPEGFIVETGASLDVVVLVLPGASARIPMTVELRGEGSRASLSGIFLSGGEDEVDFDIRMKHLAPGCVSHQLFNGLAAASAKCSFNGKIVVAPEAQRTEAYQENHNILLSQTARINTKPQLEIYADDVKCSHGATVGQLNEDEVFYMRSRGIPEDEAKALQMVSFIAPVVGNIPESQRSSISDLLESAIRSLL